MSPPGSSPVARWMPVGGVAFVALWIGAFATVFPSGDSDAEIAAYYADDGNRGKQTIGLFLVLAASLCFLSFLAALRDRLAEAEGRGGPLTQLAFGAGLVATALWVVAGVFFMAVAYTEDQDTRFVVDPNTERLVSEMGYLIWVSATPVALLVVLASSVLALRTCFLPRWLAWPGLVSVATMVVFLAVIPFVLFLAWVLITSIVLMLRAAPVPSATPVPT